jgi:periplasmic protein TonB
MRLSVSILAAVALHGVVFAIAAGLPRRTDEKPAAAAVELEVLAAKPDPIADFAPGTSSRPTPKTPAAKLLRHWQRPTAPPRAIAASAPEVAEPNSAVTAPATPQVAPPPPTTGPIPARVVASPGTGLEISAEPRYRSNPKPQYPIPSLRRQEEGVVFLNVVVRADGSPAEVSLNRSSGHPLLDQAALDVVRHWTFEPARAAGVPVSSKLDVPVRFSLTDYR